MATEQNELPEVPDDLESLSRDELAELDTQLTEASEVIADQDDISDTDLEQIQAIAEDVQRVRQAAAAIDEAEALELQEAEDRKARAAELRAEIAGPDEEEPVVEDEPVVEEIEAVEEPVVEDEPVEEEEPELVMADAKLPRLSKVAARRPAETAPVATPAGDIASLGLTAAANAPGVTPGAKINTWDDLAEVFVSAYSAANGYVGQGRDFMPVVTVGGRSGGLYPESHSLDSRAGENLRKIEATQAAIQREGGLHKAYANGVQASGGICAPQETRYDQPVVGDDARPVRDEFLARFAADRGGVATLPPPVLADVDGSVDSWSNANDLNPSDPTTKPCLTVTCPSESTSVVEAITYCIEYGNFRARYFPEQIEAWMQLVMTHHARFAEERLLATIATGSTAVTAGQVLGTTRDVLAGLDRANAIWRYRHREPNLTMAFAAPVWLRDQIRTDIARQLPVGTTDETLALADATIDRFFASRQIDPTWIYDGESGQRFTSQGVGAMQGWPSTVKTYFAPAGSWLFLDGGELRLGLVRDSTLNSTNDVQFWGETFEGAHFHGPESWTITFDTCPDGATSSTVDIDPCTSGS